MSVGAISTSNVNAIKGTEFEGMSIQMMAAMVMIEVGATKKKEAENKIAEMKGQNDRAKALNSFLDKLNGELGKYTKDEDKDKAGRLAVLTTHMQEAKNLGIDVSNWTSSKSSDQVRAISSTIQHMAENCNSDNQTQMVKLQDFMGQYNSFVSGASDQIKNANQILQGLAKN
ncbi:hypothetical protein SAMN02745213_00793 [Succinivibrio dextrinosolvens DSM 3072]|uniref:EspA-like secreted protein n=1 Tax=Succinivibrio dextrinosolvens DSM 3072 TaxID=1123324 RepID=A0A1T4V524_9GAMM|nr:hypothetical protein [Succinivibrio dextrinosolvens]SKA60033.1 hypothetical protein SAMN02745213_00793 [Succinivibrio dextrinosolvens DSM 3072]